MADNETKNVSPIICRSAYRQVAKPASSFVPQACQSNPVGLSHYIHRWERGASCRSFSAVCGEAQPTRRCAPWCAFDTLVLLSAMAIEL